MSLDRRHVLLGLLIITAAQIGWYEPRLPDQVVSNFDYDGTPNGWSGKGVFLSSFTAMMVMVLALFHVLSWTIRRLGGRGINVPHRDYWLAPGRRDRTAAFIAGRLEWFGLVTYGFLLWTQQLSINANLVDPPRLAALPFWLGVGGFLFYSFVWTYRLISVFQTRGGD